MKVLIVSHNPISTYNNMGKTLGSLFAAFSAEELCQLYLHPSVPDTNACHSYYRITDRDVLMSYAKLRVKGGVVKPDTARHELSDNTKAGMLYRRVKNVGTVKRLGRDLMWKLARWYNKELKAWIAAEAPTHIFVAPGMPKLLYYIAFKLSKKHSLPIITYICDDYYFLKPAKNPLARFANWRLRTKIEKLMAKSAHGVFICDPLKDAYRARFSVEATTVMTGASLTAAPAVSAYPPFSSLTYMGNLYYGRQNSLADIGRVLDTLNAERGTDYALDIYTGDTDSATKALFAPISSVKLHGFVSGAEYARVVEDAKAFVHVEGFDGESMDLVKFSVSTKIADNLSNGKVFVAYGPKTVASIAHLAKNACAFVITDREGLKQGVATVFDNEQARVAYVNSALQAAHRHHNTQTNSEKLRDIIKNIS